MSRGFDPKSYWTVAERVARSHALDLLQSVQTDAPVMLTPTMGYIRVRVTFKDGTWSDGIGSFRLDATRSAQATNPLEDAETSAVGRALAFLGLDTKRKPGEDVPPGRVLSIASADEIVVARRRAETVNTAKHDQVLQRVTELMTQAAERGIEVNHDAANEPLETASYDELVGLGRYLRSLLGGA